MTQCLHLTPVVLARETHCARRHDCPDVVSELTLLTLLTLDLRDDPADDLRFKSTVLAVAPLDLRRLTVTSDLYDPIRLLLAWIRWAKRLRAGGGMRLV